MARNTLSLLGGLAFAFAILCLGCAKEELVVSYLYVPAFDVMPSASSGAITTQITDVRVVLGAQSLGFYPLPARIPILATGSQVIRLEPAVRIAGVAANRIVYPFYEVFEEALNLVPGTVDTIRPIINYIPSATFAFVEDFKFNTSALTLDLDNFPDTKFVRSMTNPSAGVSAGKATLTSGTEILETATPVLNTTGQTWSRIWLEIDFRGDIPLTVAVLPETPGGIDTRLVRYQQGVSARDDWRKLYFELVDNGANEFATQPFRVGFLAIIDTTAISAADIFIDNVKVVYQN